MKIRWLTGLFLLLTSLAKILAQDFGKLDEWSRGIEKKNDQILTLENTGLLRGPEYKLPTRGETSHPFFESQAGALSKISFTGNNQFHNIPLLYDLYQRQLALKYLRTDGKISLILLDGSLIASFTIFDREFRSLPFGSGKDFFEVLFERGESQLVARRSKIIQVVSPARIEFTAVNEFYWIEGDKWSPLKKSSDFVRLASEKNAIKKFQSYLKENQIRLRKLNEQDILKIAAFYSQLHS